MEEDISNSDPDTEEDSSEDKPVETESDESEGNEEDDLKALEQGLAEEEIEEEEIEGEQEGFDELEELEENPTELEIVDPKKKSLTLRIGQPNQPKIRLNQLPPVAHVEEEELKEIVERLKKVKVTGVENLVPETGANLEDFLKKSPQETDRMFSIRSQIAKKISEKEIKNGKIDVRSCVVLGHMIAQKAMNDVTYNETIETIIKFVVDQITPK